MTRSIEITMPIRTISEANGRGMTKWAAISKGKRVRAQRVNVGNAVARARGGGALQWSRFLIASTKQRRSLAPRLGVPIVVTLTRIAPRQLDSDNLMSAMKAARDGVADAFGVDDRDPRVEWRYGQERGAPRTYGVRVEVRAREERAA